MATERTFWTDLEGRQIYVLCFASVPKHETSTHELNLELVSGRTFGGRRLQSRVGGPTQNNTDRRGGGEADGRRPKYKAQTPNMSDFRSFKN
jgi:hypothetical protein